MAKIQISVCENCKKESCSGKTYIGYDEINKVPIRVCESQTNFIIKKEIQYLAWDLYKTYCNKAKEQDTCMTPVKYYIQALHEKGMTKIPVQRVFFIDCGNYPNVEPENDYEMLTAPIEQFYKGTGHIYNNLEKDIKEIGVS
jgi:hypothetical protein